jgi:hypothetical protein
MRVVAVLLKSRRPSNHRQAEKQKSSDFQPENASDSSGVADSNIACTVERPDPAILAGPAPRDAQQGPSAGTKVTSCLRIFLALHGGMRYAYSSSGWG